MIMINHVSFFIIAESTLGICITKDSSYFPAPRMSGRVTQLYRSIGGVCAAWFKRTTRIAQYATAFGCPWWFLKDITSPAQQ